MHEKFLGAGSWDAKAIYAYCPRFHPSNTGRFRFAGTGLPIARIWFIFLERALVNFGALLVLNLQ
jgi:hypothetical protein